MIRCHVQRTSHHLPETGRYRARQARTSCGALAAHGGSGGATQYVQKNVRAYRRKCEVGPGIQHEDLEVAGGLAVFPVPRPRGGRISGGRAGRGLSFFRIVFSARAERKRSFSLAQSPRIRGRHRTRGRGPTVVGYYRARQLQTWAEFCGPLLCRAAGGRPGDVIKCIWIRDFYRRPRKPHYGAETLRLHGVPMSGGQTFRSRCNSSAIRSPDIIMVNAVYMLAIAEEFGGDQGLDRP